MSSIGGRPILRGAIATARGFSTAPAAVTTAKPRLAHQPQPPAAASALDSIDQPASRASYGQWAAASSAAAASKALRIAALQQHLDSTSTRVATDFGVVGVPPPAPATAAATNPDGLIQRLRASAMTAPVASAAESFPVRGWAVSRPLPEDGGSSLRQSRLAAAGRAERVSAIQHFYDASQRSPATAAVDDDMLTRAATFGLYGSSSSIEPLGRNVVPQAMRDTAPHIVDAEKVAGWAVSTMGSRPAFSAGRWLQESNTARERAARLAAIRQFYQRTGRTEWH